MRHDMWRLVLWPAAVTFGITALRVFGELLNWAPALFSRAVGGGAAPIGIFWVIPVFGSYFGYRLAVDGVPPSLGRAIAWDFAALVVLASFLGVGFSLPTASALQFLAIGAGSWAAIAVAWRGWPELVSMLLRYGFLARVPVVIVVLLGILGDWKSHYDSPPPGLPEMGAFARWVSIGVIPQLTLWMAVTVVLGVLVAAPVASFVRTGVRRPAEV